MLSDFQHRPQGALLQDDGSVLWRLWAPLLESVALATWSDSGPEEISMTAEGFGYFAARRTNVKEGFRYAFKLPDGKRYPDPASRWQPEGAHGPSAVWFPSQYAWNDGAWRGVARSDLVIYELHVGVFTPEGTFEAIIPRLEQLTELGVTALELMPIAQFSGERNWGYDGVYPFAVQNSYGGPRALQRLIDAAHGAGLAVFLDVVYNHFGPEGNYSNFFGPYTTSRYPTPWGKAINLDGPDSDAVRQSIIDNACMWVRDFHADGLRLDAVHAIYDFSAQHLLAELQQAVQAEAKRQNRRVHVIAESDLNDVRLVKPLQQGGHGLDGVWSDDFHHSVHALLTGERDGYYRDFGTARHLVKAINDVFVYNGCYSPFRKRRHGNHVGDADRTQFVVAIQNHDQVGNRARGDRLTTLLPPEAQRLACALLMLSPCVPLLWMGEEYGETRPFPFFCSFADPDLVAAVRRGRREEFANLAFSWGDGIPDPQAIETFLSAKLQWEWSSEFCLARRRLYADLLAVRRRWPALRERRHTAARWTGGDRDSEEGGVLVIERGRRSDLIAFANLDGDERSLPSFDAAGRTLLLSTEDKRYGGRRASDSASDGLLPYELQIHGPERWRQ